jgi:hypothetical protein
MRLHRAKVAHWQDRNYDQLELINYSGSFPDDQQYNMDDLMTNVLDSYINGRRVPLNLSYQPV